MAKVKGKFESNISSLERRKLQKMKQDNDIPSLPEDIIFNILIWLPAKFLHKYGRYVCKAWANIIQDSLFINTHLQHSKAKLVMQDWNDPDDTHFVEIEDRKFTRVREKSKFGYMLASYDGISLFINKSSLVPCVANTVTLQVLELPRFPVMCHCAIRNANIARVPSTGEFKVVFPFLNSNRIYDFLLVTVGKNMSWRTIVASKASRVLGHTYTVGGVMYWRVIDGIIAIDLHDEASHFIEFPNGYGTMSCMPCVTGNHLSCIVREQRWNEINICVLKGSSCSEWTIVRKLDLEAEPGKPECLIYPIAWFDENGPIMFGRVSDAKKSMVVAYDVWTGRKRHGHDIEFSNRLQLYKHTDSLVSL